MSTTTKVNILIGLLVVSLLWGLNEYYKKISYKRHLEAQYQRMFYDLVGSVETIQTDLAKVNISTSQNQNIVLLSRIVNESYSAQEKMSQLPLSHTKLSKTEKFLSQIGDYSQVLIKETLTNDSINEKDRKKLDDMQKNSMYLGKELSDFQNKISTGKIDIADLNKKLKENDKNILSTSVVRIEERMNDTPELIYDGPFSEHIGTLKPRLKGEKITESYAKQKAIEYLKYKGISDLTYKGKLKNATISGYIYANEDLTMAISEVGGKLIWLMDSKNIDYTKLSKEDALSKAKSFLKSYGYENMTPTYSLTSDNTMLINFASKKDEVTIYPDIVKIKISLIDGDMVGFDSTGYLVSHYDRTIEKPSIDISKATKNILSKAKLEHTKLVIIPTEGKGESLCYEFRVKYTDREFLVYVDAKNGSQTKILELIKNENGTLTV